MIWFHRDKICSWDGIKNFLSFISPKGWIYFYKVLKNSSYGTYTEIIPFSDDHYKHVTIVNDDSSGVIKWSFKLIDATRGVIYDRHMFIIQATGIFVGGKWFTICNNLFYFIKWHRLHTPIDCLTWLENEEDTSKFVNQIYFQFRNLSW